MGDRPFGEITKDDLTRYLRAGTKVDPKSPIRVFSEYNPRRNSIEYTVYFRTNDALPQNRRADLEVFVEDIVGLTDEQAEIVAMVLIKQAIRQEILDAQERYANSL